MKRTRSLALVGLVSHLAVACGGDGADPAGFDGFDDYDRAGIIVADFAEQIAVPTYAELAARLAELDAAAATLASDTNDANLDAARVAWLDAREPWESSEAFAFGPAASLDIAAAVDGGPVDTAAVDGVLAGTDSLTPDFVGGLEPGLRGFHAAEYLLFGDDGSRSAAELGDRELAYLTAVTALLVEAGDELEAAWTQERGDQPAFAVVFRSAGRQGNTTYPTLASAGSEIVRGMIAIADEVASTKLGAPFEQMDAALVESRFSSSSLTDFRNNARSIQYAYTGGLGLADDAGLGVSDYVAAIDADLDARVRAQIQGAIDALALVPTPFSAAVLDPQAADEIAGAQQALRTVHDTLEADVLPLFW